MMWVRPLRAKGAEIPHRAAEPHASFSSADRKASWSSSCDANARKRDELPRKRAPLSTIGAVHKVQRCDDAEIERCLANRLAVEDRSHRFVSLAEEGGRVGVLHQPRMKEMDYAAAVRNIDPTLHEQWVGLAVTIFDDPIAQTVL